MLKNVNGSSHVHTNVYVNVSKNIFSTVDLNEFLTMLQVGFFLRDKIDIVVNI